MPARPLPPSASTPHAPPRPEAPDAGVLLDWYGRHRRHLPWRAAPGERADPYRVWLSEIMLQQTTVKTVGPYFNAFIQRWPRLADLAAAPLDDVLKAWAGLGYYSRARNLHAAAREVMDRFGGDFPSTEEELKTLPGIGDYTAAAIAAIAFGRKATVVDGNIERVVARLFAVEEPLPRAKPELKRLAASLVPDERAGDFAQAMMDLGAAICTPRSPSCGRCPWGGTCQAAALGIAESLPVKAPKKEKPTRLGAAFWCVSADGHVLLRRRPPKGLLGGMSEVPSGPWLEGGPDDALEAAPFKARWEKLAGEVRHTFTHFHLRLTVYAADVPRPRDAGPDTFWVPLEKLGGEALPTVMRKVAAHARSDDAPLLAPRSAAGRR